MAQLQLRNTEPLSSNRLLILAQHETTRSRSRQQLSTGELLYSNYGLELCWLPYMLLDEVGLEAATDAVCPAWAKLRPEKAAGCWVTNTIAGPPHAKNRSSVCDLCEMGS